VITFSINLKVNRLKPPAGKCKVVFFFNCNHKVYIYMMFFVYYVQQEI
jgi:hypothetical protein